MPPDEIDEAAWDTVIAKYRIDAVLWVREHVQLRQFLVERRGWKEEYTGLYERVYVRPKVAEPTSGASHTPEDFR